MYPRFLFACTLLCVSFGAQGGQPWEQGAAFSAPAAELAAAAAQVKPKKATDVVILLYEERYVFDRSNRLTHTGRIVYRIDSPRGVDAAASVAGYWQPWRQKRPEIRGRVISRSGQEHLLDATTLMEGPARNDVPLIYENNRVYGGPLPGVSVGSIVEHEVAVQDTDSFFAAGTVHRVIVGRPVPVMFTRVVVDAPKELPLKFAMRLLPQARMQENKSGDRTVVTVEQGPLDAMEDIDSNLPTDMPLAPQVEFSTGASWQAVARSYLGSAEPKIRPDDTADLLGPAAGKESTLQLATRLVERLHREVRYTSLLFGESQLIPQYPAETLQRKFGDCKDKSALLVAMLRRSGVQAHLALLFAGAGQDVSPDFPGFGLFNHAIVYVPGKPDLWIDATAQYTRVGELPAMDRGRLALVIRDGTVALLRTPLAQSQQNKSIETRELLLAEDGPAKATVTLQVQGDMEEQWRTILGMPGPNMTRRILREYAKSAYRAEELENYEVTGPEDFSRPFVLKLELPKAARFYTGEEQAAISISPSTLIDRLPGYFWLDEDKGKKKDKSKEKNKDDEEEEAAPKPPRTADVIFEPFVTELKYRIVPPSGFRARSLPKDSTLEIGPARFSQTFALDPQGTVNATLRFDSVRGRYTVAEAQAARKALKALGDAPALQLNFENIAFAQLKAGDIAGAMRAYDGLAAQHPKEASHHIQKAKALLDMGLAEHALQEAETATTLEPKSTYAWRVLGWVREHDLFGRTFGPGYDRQGAVDAYRQAKKLAADDEDQLIDVLSDLAVLLEYDAAGVRYSSGAQLDAAVAEYREREALLGEREDSLPENLSYALFYGGRFEEVRKAFAKAGKPSKGLKALSVSAVAALSGMEEAVQEAHRLAADESERSNILMAASGNLTALRRYSLAADLMAAGAQGQANSAQAMLHAEALRKTRPYEETLLPPIDPRYPVQRLLLNGLGAVKMEPAGVNELFSRLLVEQLPADEMKRVTAGARLMQPMRPQEGLPPLVMTDTMLGGTRITAEGDDTIGYRIAIEIFNSPGPATFVVKEDGQYRILGLSGELWPLGRAALERIAAGDPQAARRWLDRARDMYRTTTDDEDPLASNPFPRVWKKGQEADGPAIKLAAAMLLSRSPRSDLAVDILLQARESAATPREKLQIDLALAHAYSGMKRWNELLERSRLLLEAEPDSATAFGLMMSAQRGLGRWQEVEAQAAARLKRLPKDRAAVNSLVRAAEAQGQYQKIRDYLRPLLKDERVTYQDYNRMAWYGLLTPPVDTEALDAARAAYKQTGGGSFDVSHTLACLYASTGKPKEARDLMLESMKIMGPGNEEKSIWYAYGLIAEACGDSPSGIRYYQRALGQDNEDLLPSSSERLAQTRLQALKSAK